MKEDRLRQPSSSTQKSLEKNLASDTSTKQPQIHQTSTFDVKSDSKVANEVTGSTSNSVGGGGNRDSSGDGGNRSRASDRSNVCGGKDNNRDGDRPGRDKFHHHQRAPKRDPDCTLVIKNLADNTREADVLALFNPFAQSTNSKIVGITVSAHRGIAFMDYDNVNPVLKAVTEHKNEKMMLQGRALEFGQKTAEQRDATLAASTKVCLLVFIFVLKTFKLSAQVTSIAKPLSSSYGGNE